jgi:hypothetical protein
MLEGTMIVAGDSRRQRVARRLESIPRYAECGRYDHIAGALGVAPMGW